VPIASARAQCSSLVKSVRQLHIGPIWLDKREAAGRSVELARVATLEALLVNLSARNERMTEGHGRHRPKGERKKLRSSDQNENQALTVRRLTRSMVTGSRE
jgi:hypothetical protein